MIQSNADKNQLRPLFFACCRGEEDGISFKGCLNSNGAFSQSRATAFGTVLAISWDRKNKNTWHYYAIEIQFEVHRTPELY
jgi:hypothetical protein